MLVRDIMSSPPKVLKLSQTAEDAAEMMALHDVGALPVCEGDELVGVVTDRDVVLRCVAQGFTPAKTPVTKIMTRPPATIDAGEPAEEAAWLLTSLRIRRLPVTENGRLVGMVTADDIARRLEDDDVILRMARRVAPRRRAAR
jgi:CBS domain-containing protein